MDCVLPVHSTPSLASSPNPSSPTFAFQPTAPIHPLPVPFERPQLPSCFVPALRLWSSSTNIVLLAPYFVLLVNEFVRRTATFSVRLDVSGALPSDYDSYRLETNSPLAILTTLHRGRIRFSIGAFEIGLSEVPNRRPSMQKLHNKQCTHISAFNHNGTMMDESSPPFESNNYLDRVSLLESV